MAADLEMDADDQDMAEIFDEDNITEDGVDIATSDMERDVYDVTAAVGDDDDFDAEDDDDFDPDKADDEELNRMTEEDDGIDSPGGRTRDAGDLVMESDQTPAAFEGGADAEAADDDDSSLYGDDAPPSEHKQRELDHGIEETFPASDPVSITPGAD